MAWGPYLVTSNLLEVGSPFAATAEGSPSVAAVEGSLAAKEGSLAAVEGSLALVIVLMGSPALAILEEGILAFDLDLNIAFDLDLDIAYLLF